MRIAMIVQLSKLGKRLQGKPAGRKHYAEICGFLAEAKPEEVVVLDFEGVESVNASWINMAIAPLILWCSQTQNDFFPVLARFPKKDFDELELVAEKNQQCYAISSAVAVPLARVTLIGPLDPSLRSTLTQLQTAGEVTGAELARTVPDAEILPTAWNNRLKDLHTMRLLFRRKEGRQQVYSPLATEVLFHG
jgi:hypothetical protein